MQGKKIWLLKENQEYLSILLRHRDLGVRLRRIRIEVGEIRIRLLCTKLCLAGDEDTHCHYCFYQRECMGHAFLA
jgi:hypothetical protein